MQKIRKDLFPDVIYEGKTYTNGDVSPLVQIVKQEGYKGKIVVSGEGSIGKSTMLTDLRLSLLREERAFVYFNLRDQMDTRDVEALADRVNGYKGDGLIVILDSYDETSMTVEYGNSARAKAERLIDDFATRNNVALLIVGARQGCKSANTTIEFDGWARDRGFKTASLQRFSDEKLDSILSDRKNISPELKELLKNTMFLSMYLEAPEKDWESAASEAKFIDKYFDEVFCAKLEKGKPEDRGTIKATLFSQINAIGENIWNGYCRKPRNRVDFDNRTELNTIFMQEQKKWGDWEIHATQKKYLSYSVAKYLSQKYKDDILNIFHDRSENIFLPIEGLDSTINEGLYYTGQLLSDAIADQLNDVLHKTSDKNVFCLLSQIIIGHNKGGIRYGETTIKEFLPEIFWHNIHMRSIELPVNTKNIEAGSFIGCISLERINISEENDKYKSIAGNLYSKDGRTLIQYAIGKAEDYFEIPSRVETIGMHAFYESQSLKRITIPGSVKVINASAFRNCQSLESVEILDGIETIKGSAFGNCQSIKSITIPSSVKVIGPYAFYSCHSLESVELLDGVGSIENFAFSNCQSIKSIIIPGSVKVIGPHAFYSCQSLESVEFLDGIETIERDAFSNCLALKSITIPGSVKTISYNAFRSCQSLENVELLEGIIAIESFAFINCQELKSIIMPGSIKDVDKYAFYKCMSLCQITVDENNNYYKSINGNLYSKDMKKLILYAIGKKYDIFNIPSHVEIIDYSAFSESHSLKRITIPGNVKVIGEKAFAHCKSLEHVKIEEGVAAIKSVAFEECQSLKSIAIAGSVKVIGSHAFRKCQSLESVELLDGIETIEDGAFEYCQALKSITIPGSVKDIGNYFGGGHSVERVVLLDGVGSIEYFAFSNCQSIKSIIIPGSVKVIGPDAFHSCQSLESVEFLDGIETIEEGAFSNCQALKNITIPGSVKVIGPHAFYSCQSLKRVELLDGIETIEEEAFSNCQALKNITIPGSVKIIGEQAFDDCQSLEGVEILEGVKVVEFFAFWRCQSLKKVTIPHSIEKINNAAFSGCESLSTVYYGGTEKEWEGKGFDKSKELAAAEKYYYCEQEPESEGNYWHYGEDGAPTIWKK